MPQERDPSEYCPAALAPERTMLGIRQRDWLLEELATSTSFWNILAQQTAFAPLDRGARPRLADNWDGYVAERQVILDWIAAHGTPNPIVITGDSHSNWVRNVPPNYVEFDAPPVATEFMGTSLASGGDPVPRVLRFRDDPRNPHVLLRNNNRGYVLCTATAETWTSDYRVVPTVLQRTPEAMTLATFAVEDGRAGAQPVGAPAV